MNDFSKRTESSEHITSAYMEYAVYTIVDRALPDVRDGLKPVHRRILYGMNKNKMDYNRKRAKSIDAVGSITNYHYHGDSSIYNALSILTEQNGTLLHPFIDGEGGFGNVFSSDFPSAQRYTYCRLNEFCDEMFDDLNKKIVRFIGDDPNYLQPVVLPATFPNILIKPNQGIAVGEACNFPSFNLNEVCNFTIEYLANKDAVVEDYIKAPDFSSKAQLVYNERELDKIFNTGSGNIVLRGRYRYVPEENIIEIYEIPYNTKVENIIAKVNDLIATGQCKEITDIRDEQHFDKKTKQDVMMIAIDVKKNTDVEKLMNLLYKKTPLQSTMSINMNCLVDNVPKVLGIKAILDEWIKFRHECIINSKNYDLVKKQKQLHLNLGLNQVLLDLDKAIEIVRKTENDEQTISELMVEFKIDNEQAEYVADIKLRNFNKNFFLKKVEQIELLKEEVADLNDFITNKDRINNHIKEQLLKVKSKYGKERQTEILYSVEKIKEEELIDDYNCTVVITKDGYVKKNLRYLENQKVKDGDEVISVYPCKNTSKLLVFTDKNNVYTVGVHQLSETVPSALGQYIPSVAELDKDENIIYSLITSDFSGYMIFGYRSTNKFAKIKLETYQSSRAKLTNAYNKNEVPMFINYEKEKTEEDDLIFYQLKSSISKVLIINGDDLSIISTRTGGGVTTIKSKNGSVIESVKILTGNDIAKNPHLTYYLGTLNSVGKYHKANDVL